MKLLYCHDNMYFHSNTGEVYSQGQFPSSYFQTFTGAFKDVTIIGRGTPLDKNYNLDRLNLSSGENLDFQLLPNMNSLSGLFQNYRYINKVVREKVAQSDAVIIRAVSDLGWVAYKHAKRMKKPIAMEMAACAWDSTWNHGSRYGRIYAPIRYIHDYTITKNADFAIYVTQDFLQKRYPNKGHTAIASNVRLPDPDPVNLEKRLERIANRSKDDIITIGIIATLGHKLKGIHNALAALGNIEKRHPNRFVFRILGPGNPQHFVQIARNMGIEHCVFFDGILKSGDAVMNWLANVDIYIQPSYQEGVPRATIESMSMACPAIGSTAGGIPELLAERWLHEPGDEERLENLLEQMMENKDLQIEAAKANFERSKFYQISNLKPIKAEFWKKFAEFTAEQK